MRAAILASAGIVAVVAFVVARQRQVGDGAEWGQVDPFGGTSWTEPGDFESAAGTSWVESWGDSVKAAISNIASSLTGYTPEKVPVEYRAPIAKAEAANGIPAGMLARLLWQESRYRADIISGRVKSPAGAIGIAQFMPATAAEWGVNPYDPLQSIDGAGRYLAWLYRKTGTWAQALAAYNWGIGNVQRKGLQAAPTETRTYYTSILSDLGMTA